MKFSKLNVSVRLAIGFSVVFVGALVLALAGWYGIQREAQMAENVLEEDVEFMRSVANIRARVQMLRRFEKDMLLVLPDIKKADEYKKSWDDARARLNELLAGARKAAAGDAERKRLDQLALFLDGYSRGMEQVHAAIAGGQIATSDAGYKKVGEFRQQIRDTEGVTGELFDGANKRMEAVKPELAATARQVTLFLGVVAVAVLLLSAALGVLITRSIIHQLGGEPGYAVDVANRVAGGDLASEVHLKSGDNSSLLWGLRKMRDELSKTVETIRAGSESVHQASEEISQGNADLSSRTEEQASALEETSASMQEMTATVSQNAENAKKANELASQASGVAIRSGEAVREVVGTMNAITESSRRIADIIGVIDGIAFQTNILALNAAVEAARAGEQGRGFAVVASEVRNLAQRSAAAAKEIKTLITDSVANVDTGSRQVETAGRTVDEVVASVKRVNQLIAEIASASQEQSQGIEQVTETMTQMEKVTQQNAAMVEEASAAAATLQEQAGMLNQTVAVFKLNGTGSHAAPMGPRMKVAASARGRKLTAVALPEGGSRRVKSKANPDEARTAKEDGWQTF